VILVPTDTYNTSKYRQDTDRYLQEIVTKYLQIRQ